MRAVISPDGTVGETSQLQLPPDVKLVVLIEGVDALSQSTICR